MNSLAPYAALPKGPLQTLVAPLSPYTKLSPSHHRGSECSVNTQQTIADTSVCMSALSHSRKNLGKLTEHKLYNKF